MALSILACHATNTIRPRVRYKDDLYFALATVYFIVVLVALFTIAHLIQLASLARRPRNQVRSESTTLTHRAYAAVRYFSYRVVRIRWLGWYSPAIGVILVGCAAWVYFGSRFYLHVWFCMYGAFPAELVGFPSFNSRTEAVLLAKHGGSKLWKFAAHCKPSGVDGCRLVAI